MAQTQGRPETAAPAAIELRGISKAFGPVQANKDIDLTVARGSSHLQLTMRTTTDTVTDSNKVKHLVGRIGVGGGRPKIRAQPYTVAGAIGEGWRRTVDASTQVGRTIGGSSAVAWRAASWAGRFSSGSWPDRRRVSAWSRS